MNETDPNLVLQCAQALPHLLWISGAPILALIAPHVDAWLKQPTPGSLWLLVRKPFSILFGNYGWAKNADQETLSEWWTLNRTALAAWLINAAGEELKAEIVKAQTIVEASSTIAPPWAPKQEDKSNAS